MRGLSVAQLVCLLSAKATRITSYTLNNGGSRPSDKGKGGGGGEGGDGHPDPEIRGRAASEKKFSALRASFSSKTKGKGRAPPLDPPLLKAMQERNLCSQPGYGI